MNRIGPPNGWRARARAVLRGLVGQPAGAPRPAGVDVEFLMIAEQGILELQQQVAAAELALATTAHRLATTEQHQADLRASTAWGVVLVLWRVRTLLLPHGGKRDRTLWWLIRGYRSVYRRPAGP